jgi:AcrR family transcriptional regulator
MSQGRQASNDPRDTRQRLLDAAWRIVCSEGLRSATSRRIAGMADANLGAITYYFGSKDRLLAEAAVAHLERWTQPLAGALLGDEADGGDRTEPVITSLLRMLQGGVTEARGMLEAVIARDVDDQVRAMMRQHLSAFQHVVADLIARQQERGEIPATVRPEAMAGMFTAFALGLMAQQIIGANPVPIPDIVGQLLNLLAIDRAESLNPRSGNSP